MAIIKAVSSRAPISAAINYVSRDEKTESKLLSGYNLTSPDTAMDEMQATKEVWGKTGGRTYKHFVQSFAPDEDITHEQAHDIAAEFAEKCPLFKGFEVLIATHKDREHIHTHFVVNSVSFEDGHKFQMKSTELQDMKDLSDKLCSERGLSVTRKGQTFHGEIREETTAYSKEQYRLLQKSEQGKADSYVQNIALAVLECREQATSREDFLMLMSERGYAVKWEDARKYVTFTDIHRQEHGEKKCSVRNNKLEQYYHMDFSKEGLEREFESNARRQAEQSRASDFTRELTETSRRSIESLETGTGTEDRSRTRKRPTSELIAGADRSTDTAMRTIRERNADKVKRAAIERARKEQAAKAAAAKRRGHSR
jgi:hypothetical protein